MMTIIDEIVNKYDVWIEISIRKSLDAEYDVIGCFPLYMNDSNKHSIDLAIKETIAKIKNFGSDHSGDIRYDLKIKENSQDDVLKYEYYLDTLKKIDARVPQTQKDLQWIAENANRRCMTYNNYNDLDADYMTAAYIDWLEGRPQFASIEDQLSNNSKEVDDE